MGFITWMFLSSLWAPESSTALWNAGRYVFLVGMGFMLCSVLALETHEKKSVLLKAFIRGFLCCGIFLLNELYGFPVGSKLYLGSSFIDKCLFIKGVVTLGFMAWPFLLVYLKRYPSQGFGKSLGIVFGLWG